MKLLSIFLLMTAMLSSPAFAKSEEPTAVPETKLSVWLPDVLTKSEPDEEAPPQEDKMFESFEFESQSDYDMMSESDLTASIIVFKLKKDHGLKMIDLVDKASAEFIKSMVEDEELKMTIDAKTKSTIASTELRRIDVSAEVDSLKITISSIIIGGSDEIIVLLGFYIDDAKDAVDDWKKIIDSIKYDGKSPSKFLPWEQKPEAPTLAKFSFILV